MDIYNLLNETVFFVFAYCGLMGLLIRFAVLSRKQHLWGRYILYIILFGASVCLFIALPYEKRPDFAIGIVAGIVTGLMIDNANEISKLRREEREEKLRGIENKNNASGQNGSAKTESIYAYYEKESFEISHKEKNKS